MDKSSLTSLLTAAFILVMAESCQAEDMKMEKCKINGPDGKSLIKAGMTDCAGGGKSCAGSNGDGDPTAWIYLPAGVCEKIKGGCLAQE